jgi:hypothetical protein
MDDNGRPDTPRTDQKPLDEGETSDDKIEEFPTTKSQIIRRPLFNPKPMLPRGNDPSVFLQKEKEAAEAEQRNKTKPMFMTPSSDPFKFLKYVRTDAARARDANEPRALLRDKLDKTLLRPNESGLPTRIGNLDRGGRRRSKKSDTKKSKNKYKSRSRSRISTKRKNKNRRQTRK